MDLKKSTSTYTPSHEIHERIYHKIVNFRRILGGRLIQRVDLYTGKYGIQINGIQYDPHLLIQQKNLSYLLLVFISTNTVFLKQGSKEYESLLTN